MNRNVHIDDREFKRAIEELRRWKRMEVPKFVLYRAKIVCQDLIKWTPPCSKHPSGDGFNEQKLIGWHAVQRDIDACWRSANSLLADMEAKQPHAADQAKKYIRSGNLQAFRTMLKDLGFGDYQDVVLDVTESMHDSMRNAKQGRVVRGMKKIVLRVNSLKQLVRLKLGHVGKWKAGWNASAAYLRVAMRDWPLWVRKQANARGTIVPNLLRRDRPTIIMYNDEQGSPRSRTDEILGAVMRINERKMMIELEQITKHEFAKHSAR